jgi:hypothetical protein
MRFASLGGPDFPLANRIRKPKIANGRSVALFCDFWLAGFEAFYFIARLLRNASLHK